VISTAGQNTRQPQILRRIEGDIDAADAPRPCLAESNRELTAQFAPERPERAFKGQLELALFDLRSPLIECRGCRVERSD
jgi:hypothetical protein